MVSKKDMKPSECPDAILKSLVKAYDDTKYNKARTQGLDFIEIVSLSGMIGEYATGDIDTKEVYTYLHQLQTSGYIYECGHSGTSSSYKVTREGIRHAYWLVRPWYRKAFDLMKGDVRTIVVSFVSALIVTIATFFILRALE